MIAVDTNMVVRLIVGDDEAQVVRAMALAAREPFYVYEEEDGPRWALERFRLGGDLADHLHIVSARRVGRFASFEERLLRRAGEQAPAAVEIP